MKRRCIWFLIFFFGCSSAELVPIKELSDLPDEAPSEFQEKFRVSEALQKEDREAEGHASSSVAIHKKVKSKAEFSYPNRREGMVDAFFPGERAEYELTYFGVAAGAFTVSVPAYKTINHRKVYSLLGRAQSSKVFSLFYKVDDSVESYFDYEGLFSHRFEMVLDESKQTRRTLELYDSEKKQTFYWNRWNHYKKGYIEEKQVFPTEAFTQDSLSGIFFMRMRSHSLEVGSKFSVPIVSEGKAWEAQCTLVRKEIMRTAIGRLPTLVFKVETKFNGVLQSTGDNFIWLSDDDRRILLRLDAKVKIGTVRALITEYVPGTRP